ncbi:UNVERIFIED_CONTAM: FAD synthase [Euhalothece sp. KZN 001]
MSRRVVAQGTFDLLHPGHLHYLREAAMLGDELHVIIARAPNIDGKPTPVLSAGQRAEVIDALGMVTAAHLGDPEDIFVPIEAIDPAVIVLGHDQRHDPVALSRALTDRGIDAEVVRVGPRTPAEDELLSSGQIIDRIIATRSDH